VDDDDDDNNNNNHNHKKFYSLKIEDQLVSENDGHIQFSIFLFPFFCFKTQMLKYDVEDSTLSAVLWSLVSTETNNMD
jgi:hypothetical protein